MTETWSVEAVRALGVRTDVATAGAIFGLTRTRAYELLSRGDFPVPTFKVGRRIVVPTVPILRLLGLDEPETARAAPATAPPADTDLPRLPTDTTHGNGTRRPLRAIGR
jgi:hypothetical protein